MRRPQGRPCLCRAQIIVRQAIDSPYTRIPLWSNEPENIIGVLHAKDLLRALAASTSGIENLDLRQLATPPWFVPETTSLQDQLNAFLRRQAHIALVVDEYGDIQGIVTLSDILEEIVGEFTTVPEKINEEFNFEEYRKNSI